MATRMGGKAPRSSGKKPGVAIVIAMSPKHGEPDADDVGSSPDSSSAASSPATGGGATSIAPGKLPQFPPKSAIISDKSGGPPQPGEALFNDQRQICSNCNYFSSQGNDGVGQCMKGVPEADFTISDPDASHCKFWESQDKRSATSAAQTGNTTPPPTPAPSGPPPPQAA